MSAAVAELHVVRPPLDDRLLQWSLALESLRMARQRAINVTDRGRVEEGARASAEEIAAAKRASHECRALERQLADEFLLAFLNERDGITDAEVDRLVREVHAMRSTESDRIAVAMREDPETTAEFMSLAASAEYQVSDDPTPDTSTPASAIRAMLRADDELDGIPDPVPLVDRLFTLDSTASLHGPPGSAKSLVAQYLSNCVGLGRDFHGHRTRQGAVLYVAAEGMSGLKRRRAALREHYGITESVPITWLTGVVSMISPSTVDAFVSVIDEMDEPPVLVVLDTVARTSPGGDEGARDMTQYVAGMDQIRAATGACVLAVHHSGKDETRGARGHSSFAAAMDTMIELACTTAGRVTASVAKQKDLPSGGERLEFTIEPAAGSVVVVPDFHGASVDAELTGGQAAAYESFLTVVLDDGITSSEWKTSTTGVSERSFYRARAALVDAGKVIKKGSRYHLPEGTIEELIP